jgi:hypothetical protein
MISLFLLRHIISCGKFVNSCPTNTVSPDSKASRTHLLCRVGAGTCIAQRRTEFRAEILTSAHHYCHIGYQLLWAIGIIFCFEILFLIMRRIHLVSSVNSLRVCYSDVVGLCCTAAILHLQFLKDKIATDWRKKCYSVGREERPLSMFPFCTSLWTGSVACSSRSVSSCKLVTVITTRFNLHVKCMCLRSIFRIL